MQDSLILQRYEQNITVCQDRIASGGRILKNWPLTFIDGYEILRVYGMEALLTIDSSNVWQ